MSTEDPTQGARLTTGSARRGFPGASCLAALTTCLPTVAEPVVPALPSPSRPRVLVLTDIGNEPDDAQSLVRLLVYANALEIEGLVATTSRYLRDRVNPQMIRERVAAYEQVRANLARHADGYPEGAALLERLASGVPLFGMAGVGEGRDSEGSAAIIRCLERPDPRPLWVCVWGGPNCLAQALWRLRETCAPETLADRVGRLRVYAIADQDDSGAWIRKTFPELFYIFSDTPPNRDGYRRATWAGISGDRYYGFSGADFSLVNPAWADRHVRQERGPLGALYPKTAYIMEGDTPSFLGLIPNGLNVPERPDQGGWGGRYRRLSGGIWGDDADTVTGLDNQPCTSAAATVWRWREAYQNDFQARMEWCVKTPAEANHPPRARVRQGLHVRAAGGETIRLEVEAEDPDGNDLAYEWFVYPEAGGYRGPPVVVAQAREPACQVILPRLREGAELHLILVVRDRGIPPLHAYQRVIIAVAGEQ